ncbi:MAG: MerR family transcriptional regulator [Anaerolineae bacterium]|nr:MerR family transcriptional regulator [Anaerolineae bacterium]
MEYTIKQAADRLNLTAYTLRFYDKEGLLPFVERDDAGRRLFTDNNMEWLEMICCLKNTGMSLKQIKDYIQLCMQGDDTLEERRQFLLNHRQDVLNQIEALHDNLEHINYKIEHYNTTCKLQLDQKQSCTLPV